MNSLLAAKVGGLGTMNNLNSFCFHNAALWMSMGKNFCLPSTAHFSFWGCALDPGSKLWTKETFPVRGGKRNIWACCLAELSGIRDTISFSQGHFLKQRQMFKMAAVVWLREDGTAKGFQECPCRHKHPLASASSRCLQVSVRRCWLTNLASYGRILCN